MKRASQKPTATVRYEDKRTTPRRKSLLRGLLVFGDHFTMECVIRDLNRDGARIEVSNPHFVPHNVTLLVPNTVTAIEGTTEWRRGGMVGLSFHHTVDLDRAHNVRTRLLKQLMIEMQKRYAMLS
jgi:hypothetical protein